MDDEGSRYSELDHGNLSEPGQWRLRRGVTVLISCPNCGKAIELNRRDFYVSEAGHVRPAIECPCSWFNYVVLRGWSP